MIFAKRAGSCPVIVAVLGLLLAGCGQTVATSESLGQVHDSAVGPVLTAPDGMTLYTYDKDEEGVSNCSGACAVAWPPLLAPDDAQATDGFSVITRSGGDRQWALNGQPLYLYIGDSVPGDVDGDGVDGVWHVAQP